MKLDARQLVPMAVALALLALTLNLTLGALNSSGAWQRATRPTPAPASPFAGVDRALAVRGDSAPARDPFVYGGATAAPARPVTPRKPVPPPPPPRPLLTSIVWDADPRATIRWDGRDFSVRANTLFADFRVVSITREQVVLDKGGESLVLRLPVKGE